VHGAHAFFILFGVFISDGIASFSFSEGIAASSSNSGDD